MRSVRLYSKSECRLCQEAREVLSGVVARVPLDVRVIDVEQDPALLRLYGPHVPVADFGDSVRLYWPFTGDDVRAALERVTGVVTAAEVAASRPVSGRTRAMVLFVDRLVYHSARHWLRFIGLVVALYAGLPLLAPVLMAAGHSAPAHLIYSVYPPGSPQLPSPQPFLLPHPAAPCQSRLG
ncbi:MAG: glutaredoxin family protein, partial [Ardenticatenia bacterium]|nr:glutaredoxin family protein [Ardenticatenia bacterium]